MTTEPVVVAFNLAAWTRRHTTIDNLLFHTDAGSPCTSVLCTDRIDEICAAPSIDTVGDSFGNAMAESVLSFYRTELNPTWQSWMATAATEGGQRARDHHVWVVSWFDKEQLHGQLCYLSPNEVEEGYRDKHQTKVI